jgi:anti-sigma factor RsiW
MNMLSSPDEACVLTARALDSYISRELDAADARAVRQHLGNCPACAASAAERSHIKARLQRAVCSDVPDEALRQRIRQRIRAS